jgi:type II secretory pathway component GspD/PulD (secretin)/beta-lactamase regulating signal transducer with metallopeptidase domain
VETGPAPAALPVDAASPAVTPIEDLGRTPPLSDTTSPLESADLTVHIPWYERVTMLMEPALPYLVLGWIVGVFGLSAWHLGGWAQLQRLRRRMVRPIGAVLHEKLAELSEHLGVRRAVTLLESALVEVPTVVGWLRPVILLPASALAGLSPEQFEAILAHELAHIRRYDYLVNILQTLVEILGFYHPAVWWVSHRIRVERENCCDDVAVRVCGDSVRYARALTCMEEMRHRRAEWAIAATGGSLFDRIARLLGRPATDDRRFAWLPGLIALLLVIGIVVPAAFALAGSHRSESPADSVTPAASQTQIAIHFVLTEVYCDAVLDPRTAARAADLLVRVPAGSGVPLTAEELQQPLGDVFSRFTPVIGKGNELIDLLGMGGYAAGKLSSPKVTVLAGETASFAMGKPPARNAPEPQGSEFGSIGCTVIPTQVEDQNAIRTDVDFARTYPTYTPGDPNGATAEWTVSSTVMMHSQEAWIGDNPLKRVDKDGRERLQLLLVQAKVVDGPAPIDNASGGSMGGYGSSYGMGGYRGGSMGGYGRGMMGGYGVGGTPVMASAGQSTPPTDGTTEVLIETTITEVNDVARLDFETATQIETILGRPILPSGSREGPGQRLALTVAEFLQQHIVQQPLPQETKQALIKVLSSRGYLRVLANPKVLVRDREEAQIRIGNEQYLPATDPNQSEKIELGTKVSLTPHVSDSNSIRLEVNVEMTNLVQPPDGTILPVVTNRTIQTTVVIPDGATVAIAGLAQNATEPRAEMVLFMTARIVRDEPDVSGAFGPSRVMGRGGRAPGAYAAAPAVQDANDQILSKFIIAKVRPGRILDAQVKASLDQIMRGPWDDKANASVADVLALETDKIPADQFAAIVQLLGSAGYIDILSRPTILSRVGEPAQINIGGDPNTAAPGETVINLKLGLTAQKTADNWIRLDFDIDLRSNKVLTPPPGTIVDPQAPLKTVQSTRTTSALTIPQDRYVIVSLGGLGLPTDPDSEVLWLMIAAKTPDRAPDTQGGETRSIQMYTMKPEQVMSVLSPDLRRYVTNQPFPRADPNSPVRILTITAPPAITDQITSQIKRIEGSPQHVLLDARIVAIGSRDLSSLGIEWTHGEPNQVVQDSAGGSGTCAGRLPDQVSSASLRAKFDSLKKNNRLVLGASPQVVARDGRQFKIPVMTHEYFTIVTDGGPGGGPKGKRETSVLVIPHIGDANNIELTAAWDVNDTGLTDSRARPDVTRISTTVREGGTIVMIVPGSSYRKPGSDSISAMVRRVLPSWLGGVKENEGDSDRVVAVFVTPHLIHGG